MKRLIIPFLFFVLLGAGCSGCFDFGSKKEEQAPVSKSAIEQAFESSDSEFGSAATSVEDILVEPKRWDVDHIYSKKLAFDPPNGHWVYLSETEHNYWIVRGAAPQAGSEDPAESARASRIAVISPIQFSPSSFPTWDRFRVTMAQFMCVEGTSEQDLVGCLDEPKNVIAGKTVSGLPYEKFELDLVRKIDQQNLGRRIFIVVRLGQANDHGVLITLEKDDGIGPALELAKSMRIDVGE
jgi:hypothetical protein